MPVDFDQLHSVLSRAAAASGAAESHGTLCGAICSGSEQDAAWLSHVLGESSGGDTARECQLLLEQLQDSTGRQLAGLDMDFEPLLPDELQPLAQRVAALGFWCQGFLFGLSLGRTREVLDNLPGEAGEVIHDLAEIARAGFDSGDADDEEADEAAYFELVEYLRVAVQILYEELHRTVPAPDPDQPVTLH
ncbi:MAG: UPF0149 family protein [Gammaproteobacteria bacterium]